jgi:hypothetical protein
VRPVSRSTPYFAQSPVTPRAAVVYEDALTDGVGIADTLTAQLVSHVYEAITLKATPSTKLVTHATVTEGLTLDAVLTAIWQMLVQDGLALTDTSAAALKRGAAIAEGLALSGVVSSALTAHVLVAEVLALRDLASGAFGEHITETVHLTDAVTARAQFYRQAIETVNVQDLPSGSLRVMRLVQEGASFTDTPSTRSILHALITDGVSFLATVRIRGELYDCWVMGTEGDKPVTRYTNYNFASMCEFAGMYFGAADDGLWLMEGTTDGGQFIDAWIRTGPQATAAGQVYNIPEAFIGLRADGDMTLTVVDNEEHTNTYLVRAPSDTAIKETRVKLGRGILAQYMDLLLENVEGSDFEIDQVIYRPVVLSRRLR